MRKLLKDTKEYQNIINCYNKELNKTKQERERLYNIHQNIKENNKLLYNKLLPELEKKKKIEKIIHNKIRKKQKVINIIGMTAFYSFIIFLPFIIPLSNIIQTKGILSNLLKVASIVWTLSQASFLIPDIFDKIKDTKYPIILRAKIESAINKDKYPNLIREIKRIEQKENNYYQKRKEEQDAFNNYKKVSNYEYKLEIKKQEIEEIATIYDNSNYLDMLIGKSIKKNNYHIKIRKK